MAQTLLKVDNINVFYGNIHAVKDVSFEVNEGEIVTLIGANGAGKSTLMKAALGLLPYTGSITVDGLPVTRENLPAVHRKLGYVLQDDSPITVDVTAFLSTDQDTKVTHTFTLQ